MSASAKKLSKSADQKIDETIYACCDHERRTCIHVERADGLVKYIPLDIYSGLAVVEVSEEKFDQMYKPMVDYPAARACELYLGYSRTIGATDEALEYIGRVVNVSSEDIEMATKRKAEASQHEAEKRSSRVEKPARAGRRKTDPVVKPATKAVREAKPKAAKEPRPPKAPGEKRVTAAQVFQELIMQGKLTDDQIFAKVQEQFGLDDGKRGYVKWYRNHLRKQGKNPPEAKGS